MSPKSRSIIAGSVRVSLAAALLAALGCGTQPADGDPSHDGTLVAYAALSPSGGTTLSYGLRNSAGELALQFDAPPSLSAGAYIHVEGDAQPDGRFHVRSYDMVEPIGDVVTRRSALTRSGGVTTSKLAVLMVHFGTPDTTTTAFVNQRLFTAADSAKQMLSDSSFGKLIIQGDVFGWFQIPAVQGCDNAAIAQGAQAAAAAAGINLSGYDEVLYYFPFMACSWAGLGEIGSPTSPARNTWYNGTVDNRIFAHEIGHNFGSLHANSYQCTNGSMGTSAQCTSSEYGDPFDPMGSGVTQFSAYNKAGQGWFSGCNAVTAPSGGTFLLSPTETATTKTQTVRVPTDASLCPAGISPCFYYVEYRQPIGIFDGAENYIGSTMNDGVMVHVGSDVNFAGGTTPLSPLNLLDMNLSGQLGFTDARLTVGQTFTDPTGLTIQLLGANDGRAKVKVVKPGSTGAATCIGGATTSNGSTCSDGVKDGNETAADCGGECSACAAGKTCVRFDDCQSGNCVNGVCSSAAPSCSDHVKNGSETDVDCGGSCNPCTNTKVCANNAECLTHNCQNLRCTGNGVGARLRVNSSWVTSYCVDITVYNANPTTTINSWQINAQIPDSQITSSWNANYTSQGGGAYVITPVNFNAQLTPGTTVSIGFCADKTGPNPNPVITSVTGS